MFSSYVNYWVERDFSAEFSMHFMSLFHVQLNNSLNSIFHYSAISIDNGKYISAIPTFHNTKHISLTAYDLTQA